MGRKEKRTNGAQILRNNAEGAVCRPPFWSSRFTDFVAFAFVGVPLRARETRVKKAALLESSLSLSLSLSLSETRTYERDETDKVNAPLAPGDHRVVVFVFRPVETAPADAERETTRRRTRGERFLRFPTPTSSERKNFCRRRRCERMSARVGDERTREMREGDF